MNPPPAETAAFFAAQPPSFHERFMEEALAQAQLAAQEGEVPMGCVIVRRGEGDCCEVIARARNCTEASMLATSHAEVLAIQQASKIVGDWRLTDCALYVTKEPCPMCGGAIVLARLACVCFAVSDPKRGASTVFQMLSHPGINHHPLILPPVCSPASLDILQTFFKAKRKG